MKATERDDDDEDGDDDEDEDGDEESESQTDDSTEHDNQDWRYKRQKGMWRTGQDCAQDQW